MAFFPADEVPITLAFTHKLECTLLLYVLKSSLNGVAQACTVVNEVEPGLGACRVALKSKLGCVKESLGITVDAVVVAVADIKVCIAGYRFRKYLDFPYRLDNCIDE